MAIPVFNVLGTSVSALNLPDAVALMEAWALEPLAGRYVCVTGVHGVMEGLERPDVRQALDGADAVVPDGMPLVWLGRGQGFPRMGRVYGPDLMLALLERSARTGLSSFFYGGAPGVGDELKERMQKRYPGLRVTGTFCPPFRPLTDDEEQAAIDCINRAAPDYLWIGLSTPKQELLMAAWRGRVRAKVMFGVGAAFDFHTGRVRQAPRWIQRIGGEWFFRLCMEPRRLAGRYLRNNPRFAWHLCRQLTGWHDYPAKRMGSFGA